MLNFKFALLPNDLDFIFEIQLIHLVTVHCLIDSIFPSFNDKEAGGMMSKICQI